MAARRKKSKSGSGWSWRLAGIALCAFFALGVLTGLSRGGQTLVLRLTSLLRLGSTVRRSGIAPAIVGPAATPPALSDAIALVERGDGFYGLDADGGLRGPLASTAASDLPVLSGSGVANASGSRLVDYTSVLIRAEAGLGIAVSEMQVAQGGSEAILFLDRPVLQVVIDFDHAPLEIDRASRILAIWRGHQEALAALDMTVPGEAVARLRPAAFRSLAVPPTRRRVMLGAGASRGRARPEVTASR